jgi:predicted membrane protein
MFVAIGMTTMDLEPVKRSTRNEEKDEKKKKTFSLVADQEIYYFKKRINSFLLLDFVFVCVFVLFAVMQKAVKALQGMEVIIHSKHYTIEPRE